MRLKRLFAGFICAFLVGVVPCAAAPDGFETHKAQKTSIDLPTKWHVLDAQSLARIQAQSKSGPQLSMAAEAPQGEPMTKLTIAEAPGMFEELQADAFKQLSPADVEALCKPFVDNLKAAGHTDVKCSRVTDGKTPALETVLVLPAAANRPAINSTSWLYPNGKSASVVTVMYMQNDSQKLLPTLKKIAQSVQIDK